MGLWPSRGQRNIKDVRYMRERYVKIGHGHNTCLEAVTRQATNLFVSETCPDGREAENAKEYGP